MEDKLQPAADHAVEVGKTNLSGVLPLAPPYDNELKRRALDARAAAEALEGLDEPPAALLRSACSLASHIRLLLKAKEPLSSTRHLTCQRRLDSMPLAP